MSHAKVTLSPKELELVMNTDWILTKNAIINKVYVLFGELHTSYQKQIEKYPLPDADDILKKSPKISKGENYESLPWVMLDYPRYYSGNDSLGIRSFFWWGNCFSITLQLSGRFQEQYAETIEKYFQLRRIASAETDWLIGVGTDPWQHHFRPDNYLAAAQWQERKFQELPFIKLARKIPLQDWENLPAIFENSFGEILQMLTRLI